ncbi:tRNA methyltransferase [Candidatus Pacearchaeota archaeon]|nr:tRNA methyltransferase [Candidatus Pacearchaeota archaeon]
MKPRNPPEPKPLFLERMQKLLPDKKDYQTYLEILKIHPVKSIRCNKLKISPLELKKKLEAKNWKIKQLWKRYPEVMIVESEVEPGEVGRALEHQLGYYYMQELASILPVIALEPKKDELVLDLCAAPGSKTTQLSSEMAGTGTIVANEVSMGRLKILASNLERCGAANTIITRKDGAAFCNRLKKYNPKMQFDKILVDAPCSGEGTLRSSLKTYAMWNIKTIQNLPKIQKNLVMSAFEILNPKGVLIYSTCTHAPEENEGVVDAVLKKFEGKVKLEKVNLPVKTREGIIKWDNREFLDEVKKCARIYPQDNNTEGFFIAKFRRVK